MVFEPKLLPSQFDGDGKASVEFEFNGKPVTVIYKKSSAAALVTSITVDGVGVSEGTNVLPKDKIGSVIEIELD
jgi:ribosomal protein L25 (general stress protein Ctc)